MSERFGGEGRFNEARHFRAEKNPDIEARKHLTKVDILLAKLVETGAELPSDIKQRLRNQLQARLHALGLDNIDDLTSVKSYLRKRLDKPQVPDNFPSKDKFRTKLNLTIEATPIEQLSNVYNNPLASEVAHYGQADWKSLRGRGGVELFDYLYNLAAVMSDEFIYTEIFDETDAIVVDDHWNVVNGRHRSLVLKVVGDSFVYDSGMDNWIQVEKEE